MTTTPARPAPLFADIDDVQRRRRTLEDFSDDFFADGARAAKHQDAGAAYGIAQRLVIALDIAREKTPLAAEELVNIHAILAEQISQPVAKRDWVGRGHGNALLRPRQVAAIQAAI